MTIQDPNNFIDAVLLYRKVLMTMRILLTIVSICLLILSMLASAGLPPSFEQTIKGPNADSIKFTQYPDENIALQAVKSGDIDVYLYRIPIELVADTKKDPNVTVYDRDAGSFGLLFNPAPSRDSSVLNPFQIKQVRFAMNYLIDREFVVNDILKGSGFQMVDPFGASSPEYQNVADIVESFGFRHDYDGSKKLVVDSLSAAGAVKEDGKWTFKGNPVVIKIFIRSDDRNRNSIGEAISSDLEKLGFTVEKIFGDLSRAQIDIYGSNPQDLKWQIYTEGYAGTIAFVAYNPTVPAQMYAPWYSNMPGRGTAGFWQYSNKTLDEITQKILFGKFKSKEERTALVREAITQGLQESVRIFVAQTKEPYVASSAITGLVNDFGAGISSRFSFINAIPPGSRNTLNVGVKQISQGAWNNVGGYKDTYSVTILSSLLDSATLRDPYLGTVMPLRNNWTEILTRGPTESLNVAPDAVKWDAYNSRWMPVGNNQTAESKVTYKILYSNWHNGIPMDKNDLLYSYYFGFEWGTNSTKSNSVDRTIDPEFTPTANATLPTLKGIKFLTNNTVESYVDFWHFDEKEIADYGTVWATEPWEITAAQERLVEAGKLAYSSSAAVERGIDWLSLVNPQHASMIKDELQKMKIERYVPIALKGLVSTDDAIKRYNASIKWITDHNNAVISNGPFYLDKFNAVGQTVTTKAFRDNTYPFAQGYWASKFGEPQIASIENVDTQGQITIGQPKSIKVTIDVAGEPSNDAQLKYLISGNKGVRVILQGDGKPSQKKVGQFEINLNTNQTSQLKFGAYNLKLFAISNAASKPSLFSYPIVVVEEGSSSFSSAGSNKNGGESSTNSSSNFGNNKSGCLIATAAFRSELTPQVQYLRDFRQNYILSTISGAAFMKTFNAIYYSFSPQVADYEREQPWLQSTVKIGLYPLFGILMAAESAHDFVKGGEVGAIIAGMIASSLIGTVYIAPAIATYTILSKKQSTFKACWLLAMFIALGGIVAIMLFGVLAQNADLLSITTTTFVMLVAAISAAAIGFFGAAKIRR